MPPRRLIDPVFAGFFPVPSNGWGVKQGSTFNVEEGIAGRYRIRPKAGNDEIVAVGEAYDTLASAKEGCAAVQWPAYGATVVEADS